jgi:hypothetical protein
MTIGIFVFDADSDASSNLVTFYNYSLAFNPAKAKLALEEKNIKVRELSLVSHLGIVSRAMNACAYMFLSLAYSMWRRRLTSSMASRWSRGI